MERFFSFYRRFAGQGPSTPLEWLGFFCLLPFGWLYGAIGMVRAFCFRHGLIPSYRAPGPVISVGNLAVGGTGKTPMVERVARHFQGQGKRVAIVSRGYGGSGAGAVGVVCQGNGPLLPAAVCGDEPFLLARRNPGLTVLVAPKRALGVQAAFERFAADLVVLDDGFQHLAVQRDCDIVLLDASRPFGNGKVLPAGLLREFPSALKRGSLFMLTRCKEGESPAPVLPGPTLRSRHVLQQTAVSLAGEQISFESLKRLRGIAFAGIAHPDGFFSDLARQGLHLVETVGLADHAVYTPGDLEKLRGACSRGDYLVTTEKDGVKLDADALPLPCYQIPLGLELLEEERFKESLDNVIQRRNWTMALDTQLLDILACPQCKGEVRLRDDQTAILCESCRLAYPVRDQIPVMLIEEAEALGEA